MYTLEDSIKFLKDHNYTCLIEDGTFVIFKKNVIEGITVSLNSFNVFREPYLEPYYSESSLNMQSCFHCLNVVMCVEQGKTYSGLMERVSDFYNTVHEIDPDFIEIKETIL